MTTRVVVFTGCRSDWAHLEPVVGALEGVLTGMGDVVAVVAGGHHRAHGTVPGCAEAVLADRATGSGVELGRAVGGWVGEAVGVLERLRPDLVVVYGDRMEAMAVVTAAHCLGVRVCHVEGGDVTRGGCLDDRTRDAVTALCGAGGLHLVSCEESRGRVLEVVPGARCVVVGLPVLSRTARRWGAASRPTLVVCCQPCPVTDRLAA